ncbi:hypothetical protein HIV01_007360 [Lysobacter arenosi]|uniref:Uncharacterized protein n=1 Tax=Lysobacter arenosi TaxID=2795387 RepID=A0ABX7RDQ8_9GAMM|nr:hypothetical protein [Lysobacter arenosi]QSX76293.1 hypothetical protein HIV01_007360 [Lysobacter arenosi]
MSTHNSPATQPLNEQLLVDALRNADPDATVSIESATGQLNVSTVLSQHDILEILGGLGVLAAPTDSHPDAGHQGGQCCGSCG